MKNSQFHIKVEKGVYTLFGAPYPLYSHTIDSVLCIRHAYQDTLFKTTDALKWEPWYIIKHHKRDADYVFLMKYMLDDLPRNDYTDIYQVCEVNPLPTGVLFYYKGIGVPYQDSSFGFCKHGEKALTCSTKSFKNDLDDSLQSLDILLHPHFQKNGYLYVLVDAFEFFKEGAKAPFPGLTEESNPVLVKLKLKGYGRE